MNRGIRGAVFLSYASQDAEAARRIAEALRVAGIEVWFDQSELRGGDAWDAAIRKQIKECALFVPIISSNTQSRAEGYFRLEWRLADQRTHLMGRAKAFLMPVCIDDTRDADADVPDSFVAVQWSRLPGGETSAEFCARVRKLLGSEVAHSAGQPLDGLGALSLSKRQSNLLPRSDAGSKPALPLGRSTRRAWLVPAVVGAVVVAAALFVWRPWQGRQSAPSSSALSTPLSPARELVAKARHLFEEEDDSNRENFLLAEDLLLQAEKLDPFDGEVWAAHAQLSGAFLNLGYDNGDQRRADLRRQAERAIKLAPDSLESQLANAHYLLSQRGTLPEAERMLTALIKRAPDDWRPLRIMANVVLRQERPDEGYAWADRAAAFPEGAAVALVEKATWLFIDGRFDEAERAVDESLAIRPLGRALLLKIRAQVLWQGDLDGARATVDKVPPSLLLEDRGAFNAYRVWLWRREPDKALSVLRGVSRDFLEDGQFIGPKAVLMASAQRLAGRPDLARPEWELGLRLIDERLRASPNQSRLLYLRTLCLVELGRIPEAEEALRAFRQSDNEGYQMWPGGGLPGLLIKLGRPSEAMNHLAKEQQSGIRLFNSRAVLGLNPDFDPLRGDSRFQEILARAPGPAQTAAVAATSDSKSIAVLAFANLSNDKSNEYFSEGISDELLNVLGTVPGLKVSARTSAFHFKGKDTPIHEIAKQLGVAYVVEGSVRKSGDRVRISAQLIRAAGNEIVWSSGSLDRDLKDIFAVQDEIAGLIAANLQLKLGVADASIRRAIEPEAYRLYLEGRQLWTVRNTQALARMEELFTRTLAREPDFAPAEAGLAFVWMTRAFVRNAAQRFIAAELSEATRHALRAIELDPKSAEALDVLATVAFLSGRIDEAASAAQRAIAANPNYADAWNRLGWILARQGRFAESTPMFARAVELDPLSWGHLVNHASSLNRNGRHAEAIEVYLRVERMKDFGPVVWSSHGIALLLMGQTTEAAQVARRTWTATESDAWSDGLRALTRGWVAYLLARTGSPEEAGAIVADLLQGPDELRQTSAMALVALGRVDEAIEVLVDLPQQSISQVLFLAVRTPELRNDPRFHEVLEKLDAVTAFANAAAAKESLP